MLLLFIHTQSPYTIVWDLNTATVSELRPWRGRFDFHQLQQEKSIGPNCLNTQTEKKDYLMWHVLALHIVEMFLLLRGSGCEVLWWLMSMSACVSICRQGYLQSHARDLYFLCMLPMSVARSSSGMLTIGRIAYRRQGGDGDAQRVWSAIYDCLVLCLIS